MDTFHPIQSRRSRLSGLPSLLTVTHPTRWRLPVHGEPKEPKTQRGRLTHQGGMWVKGLTKRSWPRMLTGTFSSTAWLWKDFIFLIPRSVCCPVRASGCPSRMPASRSVEDGHQRRTSCESHAQGSLGGLVAFAGTRARVLGMSTSALSIGMCPHRVPVGRRGSHLKTLYPA